MRVSAKAEYACFAMLELAANHAEAHPVRVKTIADAQAIPPRFLVQILLQLKGAGMVLSVRGASGGYQLARPPDKISLGDVINAIDRAPPREGPAARAESPVVRTIRGVWQEIQDREQQMLRQMTLAELMRRIQETNPVSYQI
jgi:Rrf2 family protein